MDSKIWHKWTYLQNINRLTNRKQTCGCQGGMGEGWIGSLELANADYTYRVGKQQGPTGTIANLLW